MPIYEYGCNECGYTFDKRLSMSRMEEPLSEPCPECGKVAVKQNPTAAFFTDPFNLGRMKPSQGFREKLRNIKKAHPGSPMRVE